MKKLNESQLEFLKNSGMEDVKIEELQKMFEPEEDSLEKEGEAEVQADAEEKSDTPAKEVEEKTEDTGFSPQDIQKLFETVAGGLSEVTKQISGIAESQKDVAKRLEVLEQEDEDRIAQKASETPTASLEEMLKTAVVGRSEAKVDGRTSFAKDSPQETPAPDATLPGVAGMIPLLSTIQKGGDWREVFEPKDNGGSS